MATKLKTNKVEKEAVSLTEKILEMLGVEAKVEAETQDSLIKINIDGQDLGLLIGYRGENLESLQLLLGIMLNKEVEFGSWQPVLVDVGGWREVREEALRTLVEREAAKISSERKAVELPAMPPSQRRTVHLLVEQYDGLTSESTGEGSERRVVIKKTEEV